MVNLYYCFVLFIFVSDTKSIPRIWTVTRGLKFKSPLLPRTFQHREILNGTLLELAFSCGTQISFGLRIVPLYYYVILRNTPTIILHLSNVIFWVSFEKASSRSVSLIIFS